LLIILFVGSFALFAEQLNISANVKAERIIVNVSLDLEDYSNALKTIRSGLKSELFFEFRLYKKQHGIISLLGDRLVREEKVLYTGYYNMYDKYYILKRNNSSEVVFKDSDDFLRNFFSLKGYNLEYSFLSTADEYYLLCRVKYIPVKLVSPLNIVNFFTNSENITTKWEKITVETK